MAKKNRRPKGPGARPADSTRPGARPESAVNAAGPAVVKPRREPVEYVARPFEGLPGESDWVAMREIVPAATAKVTTTAEYGSREVLIASLLPDLLPALHREDGQIVVALQTVTSSGDASRDIAANLLDVMEVPAGTALESGDLPGPGPRLQDILDLSAGFTPVVHEGFDYWVAPGATDDEDVKHALDDANELIVPTAAVTVPEELGSAYWCRMNGKEFLRWAIPRSEEDVLDALSRLHARRVSALDEGSRLVGAFRTCGILVPVWELARGTEADELAGPVKELAARLQDALDTTDPLSPEERRARAGLVSRQVNLR